MITMDNASNGDTMIQDVEHTMAEQEISFNHEDNHMQYIIDMLLASALLLTGNYLAALHMS